MRPFVETFAENHVLSHTDSGWKKAQRALTVTLQAENKPKSPINTPLRAAF